MARDPKADEQPNIVFVNTHDLGTHIRPYGWGVETPHLQEMADNGVQFDNAFCTSPVCSPARSSYTTGLYPHQNGMMGLCHTGWQLYDEDSALPWHMNDAGYETHQFGFQHETNWSYPEQLGYQHIHRADDGHGHPNARARDVANRFVDRLGDLTAAEPFFATLGFVEPHRPLHRDWVPDEAYNRYDPNEIEPLPYLEFNDDEELAEHRHDLADYWGLISATVDPAVGTIREGLREHGLANNTVLIFTTDHGEPFSRGKGTCYDPGIQVSYLIEAPDRIPMGTHQEELVSHLDLFPTILEFGNAPLPDDIEGQSLLPLLNGGDYTSRDRIYSEFTWGVNPNPKRSVRTERYKFIRHFRPYAERRPGYGNGAPTRAFFDLEVDPHELTNLVDPDHGVPGEYEEVFTELEQDLYDWMTETGDPLAEGCLPMPNTDRIDHEQDYPDHIAP